MDKILNKEARNTMEALIRHKIRKLLQEKLSKNIGKPKELWKLKNLGFTRHKGSNNKHMSQYKKRVDISPRTTANTFKTHLANLASDLTKKLPDPTGKFGIPSVMQYYMGINLTLKKLVQC